MQKDIFYKNSSEKVISDKIIKVRLKDKGNKILFIHVEVQSLGMKFLVKECLGIFIGYGISLDISIKIYQK